MKITNSVQIRILDDKKGTENKECLFLTNL